MGAIVMLVMLTGTATAQEMTTHDDLTEIQFEIPNANFGRIISYQPPRTVRFGARFEF
jgi:hypothetical protein